MCSRLAVKWPIYGHTRDGHAGKMALAWRLTGSQSVLPMSPSPQLPSGPGGSSFQVDNPSNQMTANIAKIPLEETRWDGPWAVARLLVSDHHGPGYARKEPPNQALIPGAKNWAAPVMDRAGLSSLHIHVFKEPSVRDGCVHTVAVLSGQLGPGYQYERRDPSFTSKGSSRYN